MSPSCTALQRRWKNGVPKGELNPQESKASSSHKQLTSFRGGGRGGPTVGGRTGTIQNPFPSACSRSLFVHADRSLADPLNAGHTDLGAERGRREREKEGDIKRKRDGKKEKSKVIPKNKPTKADKRAEPHRVVMKLNTEHLKFSKDSIRPKIRKQDPQVTG